MRDQNGGARYARPTLHVLFSPQRGVGSFSPGQRPGDDGTRACPSGPTGQPFSFLPPKRGSQPCRNLSHASGYISYSARRSAARTFKMPTSATKCFGCSATTPSRRRVRRTVLAVGMTTSTSCAGCRAPSRSPTWWRRSSARRRNGQRTAPGSPNISLAERLRRFSVSQSLVDRVVAYLDRQAEHHRRVTFQDELR